MNTEPKITEAEISTHVDRFYAKVRLDPDHFERWLTLFAETATEVLPPDHAATVIAKSQRIAQNFKAGIAFQQSKNA